MSYWIEIAKSAFWKSLIFFFDDPKKALITSVLGVVVPTLIVWRFRSKEAFTEHGKFKHRDPDCRRNLHLAAGFWLLRVYWSRSRCATVEAAPREL